jgi:hypothetical protein
MKKLLVLSFILVFTGVKAQHDSLKRPPIVFSGVQLEFGTFSYFGNQYLERQHLQSFVPDDQLLNSNFDAYKSTPSQGIILNTRSYLGFKMFGTLTKKRKYQIDVMLGVTVGTGPGSYLNYSKQTYDTLSVFTNSTSQTVYEVREMRESYYFSVDCSEYTFPMALQLCSNKQKRLWVNAGICLAPGIRSNFVYSGSYGVFSGSYLVQANAPPSSYNYFNSTSYQSFQPASSVRRLKQTGLAGYFSVPVSVNLRASKKIMFLKHLNITVGGAPAFYFAKDKINGTSQSFAFSLHTGLRYNL